MIVLILLLSYALAKPETLYITFFDTVGVKFSFDTCVNTTLIAEVVDGIDILGKAQGYNGLAKKTMKYLMNPKSILKGDDNDDYQIPKSVEFGYTDDNITVQGYSDDKCKNKIDNEYFSMSFKEFAQFIDQFVNPSSKTTYIEISTKKPEGFKIGSTIHIDKNCDDEMGFAVIFKEKCYSLADLLGIPLIPSSFYPAVEEHKSVTLTIYPLNNKCEDDNSMTLSTFEYDKCYDPSKFNISSLIPSTLQQFIPNVDAVTSKLQVLPKGVYGMLDDGVSSIFLLAIVIIALLI